jgi:hypothetical protein
MIFNRKKKLALKMINGVDLIKLTIYKLMCEIFNNQLLDSPDEFCEYLAGATVNEIFGCHNKKSLRIYSENIKIIESGLKELSVKHSNLRQPITDSLRVYIQANQMLGSPSMNNTDYFMKLFEKLEKVNLFIKGGESPEPLSFLKMTEKVANNYGIR